MPTPTIPNGEEYFFNILYEGNGAGQRVGKFVPFTDNGTIANSCIFNDDDNAYLSRTNDAGDRDTFTISVWVKRCTLGAVQHIFDTYDGSSSNDGYIRFNADNTISIRLGSPSNMLYTTNRTFEDTSKFYHIMLSVNTNDSTAEDRAKFYIDGDRITSFSTQTNAGSADDTQFNYSSATFRIGSTTGGSYDLDAYLAEFNQVDGTALTPSTFGITDTSTGRWIPKALTGITYGTNGFRLQFGSSSALGDDTSGNTNDFSVNNLVAGDQTTDSPTQNFATHDPGFSGTIGLSEGNLKVSGTQNNDYQTAYVGKNVNSGKWYFEVTATTVPTFFLIGLATLDGLANARTTYVGDNAGSYGFQFYPGNNDMVYYDGSNFSYGSGTSLSNGNVIGVAYDADTGEYWLAVNNTWVQSGNPSSGANPVLVATGGAGKDIYFGISSYYNVGVWDFNFGQKSFTYTPPTGFKKLQQDNMPTTDKGVSGLVWTKNRDATDSHQLYDSSRGKQKILTTNANTAEATVVDGLQKFLKGGQQIEDDVSINTAGESFVSWNWVANGGTTASSTNSTVQVNSTSKFSIVQYNGTGSDQTIGHGLGVKPDLILVKCITENSATGSGVDWRVWHKSIVSSDANTYLTLNTTAASTATGDSWGDTAPTSSVFTVGADVHTNASVSGGTAQYVAYCFNEVEGFSKFGKYVGNSNADGTFVYTGFKPSFVLIKSTSTQYWMIQDSARWKFNPTDKPLFPSSTDAESGLGAQNIDLVSNGFKCRGTGATQNSSSHTYIYIAFAEHPFIGDGTNPMTAR